LQEAVEETQSVQEPAGDREIEVQLASGIGLNPPQPALVGDASATEIEVPATEAELVRFELAVAPRTQTDAQQVA
jgi:hypothetical protein